MILKSELKILVEEVCQEHEITDDDFIDDLVDRLQGTVEVMVDEDEDDEEDENTPLTGILGNEED